MFIGLFSGLFMIATTPILRVAEVVAERLKMVAMVPTKRLR